MGWQSLREAVPTVAMHMTAAAVHLMAAAALGANISSFYSGLLAALLLAVPMMAILSLIAGYNRVGQSILVVGFIGSAALLLFGHLGLGLLQTAYDAGSSPWKTLFFTTAILLPLLQIIGLAAAVRSLAEYRQEKSGRSRRHLADE